ncbi:hypothetical protein ASZ90_012166 [hydrocarbon metagenome]|uniref:Uncharacterized protein n=1 Tax=hydrocarbon metagenome TaxID=938273 RepID=A0A0W8FB71_9ZZZZ
MLGPGSSPGEGLSADGEDVDDDGLLEDLLICSIADLLSALHCAL